MSHRERLIAVGLITPISEEELYRRNGVLALAKECGKTENLPIFCVFRKDRPFSHIITEGEHECKSAELVANMLYPYEAHVLCDHLNYQDMEQPGARRTGKPPLGMYGICVTKDWEEWERRTAQMILDI